ncbi:transcription factor VBP [Lutzomyia longipalpis]|uniref:transcription factor VBP n=1 Tax=Lutzomyia longipalpis TaxID=7200 RepID=UPI0024841A2C|nr:transcription factor VBP [Lutzomyia longipalpis]
MIFGDKMCNGSAMGQRSLIEPLSFNTLHFLRTYNRIFAPADLPQCYNFTVLKDICPERRIASLPLTIYPGIAASAAKDVSLGVPPIILASTTSKCPMPSPVDTQCLYEASSSSADSNLPHGLCRRQRGEKRPIPDEQKDEKYYERRKRNNEAAKKSRDARKLREDRIAFRAAILEQENAILRAQNLALREEIATLRQIVCPSSGTQAQITTISA